MELIQKIEKVSAYVNDLSNMCNDLKSGDYRIIKDTVAIKNGLPVIVQNDTFVKVYDVNINDKIITLSFDLENDFIKNVTFDEFLELVKEEQEEDTKNED
jgi:pectate lyase